MEKGVSVIGIDNLEDVLKKPNFTFHKVDIRDSGFLLEVCKDINIIYHESL